MTIRANTVFRATKPGVRIFTKEISLIFKQVIFVSESNQSAITHSAWVRQALWQEQFTHRCLRVPCVYLNEMPVGWEHVGNAILRLSGHHTRRLGCTLILAELSFKPSETWDICCCSSLTLRWNYVIMSDANVFIKDRLGIRGNSDHVVFPGVSKSAANVIVAFHSSSKLKISTNSPLGTEIILRISSEAECLGVFMRVVWFIQSGTRGKKWYVDTILAKYGHKQGWPLKCIYVLLYYFTLIHGL